MLAVTPGPMPSTHLTKLYVTKSCFAIASSVTYCEISQHFSNSASKRDWVTATLIAKTFLEVLSAISLDTTFFKIILLLKPYDYVPDRPVLNAEKYV